MDYRKAMRRDGKKHNKTKHVTDNKGIFVLEEEKIKRAQKIKKEREEKEKLIEGS